MEPLDPKDPDTRMWVLLAGVLIVSAIVALVGMGVDGIRLLIR